MSKQVNTYFNSKVYDEFLNNGNRIIFDYPSENDPYPTDQSNNIFTKVIDMTSNSKDKIKLTREWEQSPSYIEDMEPIALTMTIPVDESKIIGVLLPKNSPYLNINPEELSDDIPNPDYGTADGKVNIYGDDYVLITGTMDNIPLEYRKISPLRIQVGESEYIPPLEMYYIDTGIPEGMDKKLMVEKMRSNIQILIDEEINIRELSWYYTIVRNPELTIKSYYYELRYNGIPIINGVPGLYEKLLKVSKSSEIFLSSSACIYRSPIGSSNDTYTTIENSITYIPDWYINEMFRDIIELQIYPGISMERLFYLNKDVVDGLTVTDDEKYITLSESDLMLIYGKRSKIYYLLVDGNRDFLPEDYQVIYDEINSCFVEALKRNIFPRLTPQHIINSLLLETSSNGQYMPTIDIPYELFIGGNLQLSFEYFNITHLFIFLLWLYLQPTYNFIIRELIIEIQNMDTPDKIRAIISYETGVLLDFLRVYYASKSVYIPRDISPSRGTSCDQDPFCDLSFITELNNKSIVSTTNIATKLNLRLMESIPSDTQKLYLTFFDNINEKYYYILSDLPNFTLPIRTSVTSSLEDRNRITNDYHSQISEMNNNKFDKTDDTFRSPRPS